MTEKNGFERRREQKITQIEKAILALLNQKEIDKISINEIAQKANVSKVTIFNYYQNKENLLNTVLTRWFQEIYAEYHKLLTDELSFEESMRKITQYKLSAVNALSPTFFENIMRQFVNNTSFFETQLKENNEIGKILFEKGRKEGKINPLYNEEILMLYLQIFTEGAKSVQWNLEKINEQSELLAQMFLNSLR